jgi:hypothetical protein
MVQRVPLENPRHERRRMPSAAVFRLSSFLLYRNPNSTIRELATIRAVRLRLCGISSDEVATSGAAEEKANGRVC